MTNPVSAHNRRQKQLYLSLYKHLLAPLLPLLGYAYLLLRPLSLLFHALRSLVSLSRNEYQKIRLAHCGKGVHLNGLVTIRQPHNLSLGNNVHINHNALINCYGPVSIGDNTHISHNFTLYSGNHNFNGCRLPYDEELLIKPVTIGKNVWIGVNVSIVPGITIGDGAIIGMGTTVTSDVPPLAIVGSAPTRILKYRDKDKYEELEDRAQYGGVAGFEYRE